MMQTHKGPPPGINALSSAADLVEGSIDLDHLGLTSPMGILNSPEVRQL